jgi:DNA-binding HxlR family transcriptional regulator
MVLRGISSNVLSKKLSQLEKQGLLERSVYEESPLRVEYKISPLALELEGWIDK